MTDSLLAHFERLLASRHPAAPAFSSTTIAEDGPGASPSTTAFIRFCAANIKASQAQRLQDLLVIFLLRRKTHGFFVEFGATDGRGLSNTYVLEKQLHWTGILAEPARCWHEALLTNRNGPIDRRCVWERTGDSIAFFESVNPEYSTLEELRDKDFNQGNRREGATYPVATVSLNDLLCDHQAPPVIDYLSIDTEGSEPQILAAFDFQRHTVNMITVEHNFVEPNRQQIRELLSTQGFVRIFESFSKFDDWYVRRPLLEQHFPDLLPASGARSSSVNPAALPGLLGQAVTAHRNADLAQAETIYRQILAAEPEHFDAQHLLGVVRHQQGHHEEALALIGAALKSKPDTVEALSNYAIVLDAVGRGADAIAIYERALAVKPDDAQLHYGLGNTLKSLKRLPEALASYDRALARKPDFAAALYNRGNALTDLKRPHEALESYDRALAADPGYVRALFNRGVVLIDLKRYAEARACFEKVRALKPDHPYAFGQEAGIAIETCDWARTAGYAAELATEVRQGAAILHPFLLIRYGDDAALQLECAHKYLRDSLPAVPAPLPPPARWRNDKIRVAYMSSDFRRHPVAYLTAELFERHDRNRFEVLGISLGHDDGSDIRARIAAGFDRFFDVRARTDADVAALLRDLKVDILVDLNGHTQDARLGILASRAAPIQVNYLGYPGTMGADFVDYVLADRIALPFAEQRFFSEKIVHLPDCLQPNDTKRALAARTPSRQEAGLPEAGFVFCCFNSTYKLTAPLFDVWMRLLRAVDGSVLWLSQANTAASANLREAARARGVDPARLIFAAKLERLEDHLARHRLADLFLDTLPYNAHTTASDALWASLPVLTCRGKSFAGRVAASLLEAVGLPELVAESLAEYEAMALRLATDAPLLRDLRTTLERNRHSHPLFNTDRLCRHIEAAYTRMWETWQRGEVAQSFAVGADQDAVRTARAPRADLPRPSAPAAFDPDEAMRRASAAYRAEDFAQVERLCRAIIAAKEDHADAHHLLAIVQSRTGRAEAALASYDRAVALQGGSAMLFNNRANILLTLERNEDALASYDAALALDPGNTETLLNRAILLKGQQRLAEALASCDRVIALRPDSAQAHTFRAAVLLALQRGDDAITAHRHAIALAPDHVEAYISLGNTLLALGHPDEALAEFDRAIPLKPDDAEVYYNRGIALFDLRRLEDAVASYERAIALRPDHAEACLNMGNALKQLRRLEQAVASYDKAVAIKPGYADAYHNRSIALKELNRIDEALASSRAAIAADPHHRHAFSEEFDSLIKLCDWSDWENARATVRRHASQRLSAINPFVMLCCSDDAQLQLKCTIDHARDRIRLPRKRTWDGPIRRNPKIKLAYVSADFHGHATAYLTAGLFEHHDRTRFEVIGVSFGSDDSSGMRHRLVKAFDRFYDVRDRSDNDVARLIRELDVDIAIDLKGYTQNARPNIFASHPAPIQVNYLGYPATMGVEFVDYILADPVVLPFDQQPFYSERIVHLPDCYQANDRGRPIAARTPTRTEAGLPEDGFVFCCFNINWKITPTVFDAWMRLLRQIEGSVLWLIADNETASANLRREASARGIEPARLVFAARTDQENHLARHRIADLFLDTLPVNAHTTASDALWAGLPVLTCEGKSFAGRVAASLLRAVGLPELVAQDLTDYEAIARRLATEPALLRRLRARLEQNRLTYPLFDTDRFRRHIEAAYTRMWETWQRGEAAQSFAVAADQGPGATGVATEADAPTTSAPAAFDPDEAMQRASAAYRAGDFAQVERLCRAVLAARDDHADAHHLLAIVQSRTERAEEALASYDRVLALQGGNAMLFNNRANCLLSLERNEEALASYDAALALDPGNTETLLNRAILLRKMKRYAETLVECDRVLAARPDHADAHNQRGNALRHLQRLEESLASHERALALRPGYAEALNGRANTLRELDRLDEALAGYEQALAAKPDFVEALTNRGLVLMSLGRHAQALESCAGAIALDPDYGDAHWNEALCRLVMGDFARGWEKYEWRWKTELRPDRRDITQPLWLGHEDISGKTILLHAEQGLGDTIQFCRYAKLVAARGARVILEVPRALLPLLAGIAGPQQVIARGDALPDSDLRCPLMSLPLALGTDLDSVPAETPYILAAPDLVAGFAARLDSAEALRVGLVWAGNPRYKSDRSRSIALAQLAPILAAPHVQFVSLQKELREGDAEILARAASVVDLREDLPDFTATAAAISALDLVVSVDTAVAHLAGALGKPTFLLLPFAPDFRWLTGRDDSPWYPTMRLFRQTEPGRWDDVVARAAEAVAAYAGGARDAPRSAPAPKSPAVAASSAGAPVRSAAARLAQSLDRALALHKQGRLTDAERLYEEILKARPDDFDAMHLLGVVKHQTGRNADALALIQAALRLKPDVPDALANEGNVLYAQGRLEEALTSYERALALNPQHVDALVARGNALQAVGRLEPAVASYERAIALAPDHAVALNNRGVVLLALKRYDQALASHDAALALKPDQVSAHVNRAAVLLALKRNQDAVASCDAAIKLDPDYAEAHYNRAIALEKLKRYDAAIASCERAIALDPAHRNTLGLLAQCRLQACDWTEAGRLREALETNVRERRSHIMPLVFISWCDDAALQRACATGYLAHLLPDRPQPLRPRALPARQPARPGERIRIAYLSADFHRHATAFLMAELFERHDRARFEVLGLSFGPPDRSEMRTRLTKAFDRFEDVRQASDREAAELLHRLEVDIALDLKGHTTDARPGILAYRPVPVQVNYLGYPGTLGADFIDYIIADATVLPFDQAPFYAEKIVQLPDCYQPNDTQRRIGAAPPTRAQAGLPPQGFVFCCFNNTYKITAPVFASWMRLLRAVPGSVLWLFRDNEAAERNLRKQAAAHGIDPERLVFAARVGLAEHLARHRLADLFLDTLPYNAHTTASDALWASLPVVTCLGKAFAGRVAASLLRAIGLPELVASSLAEYEALALRLATDPAQLAGIRARLEHNRRTTALFDSDRFRRHIEAAYARMWERARSGEPPQAFAVPALDGRTG